MILKFRIGQIRITFTIARVINVLGVNSKLQDGNHILMWDFDDVKLDLVISNLRAIQKSFDLPNIYILRTSEPHNYIAYCFKRFPWHKARAIVGMTNDIDENFYKWAVFRRRFTLRVGAKLGRKPQYIGHLGTDVKEDVQIEQLKSWVKYETLDGHHSARVHIIEVP